MENCIYFLDKEIKASFIPGDSVAEVAKRNNIAIDQPCAGNGTCGKCKVLLEGVTVEPTAQETALLHQMDIAKGIRLACQTKAFPGMRVRIIGNVSQATQILSSADFSYNCREYVQKGLQKVAIAIDIGTTTLVAYLVDINNRKILNSVSSMNPQVVFGADVISRISYASENNNNLLEMQRILILELNRMLSDLCYPAYKQQIVVEEIVVAGNTTMEHIFFGTSPVTIGKAPFNPVFYQAPIIKASALGINVPNDPNIRLVPNICGFVGGDIVAGIIYSGMNNSDDISLLIDIGTNNEMVLGNKDFMLCCSAAAGPALEGAKISSGMRASSGAIEKVWLKDDGDICIKTIYNASPIGICGSGLVDLMAILLKTGVIGKNGKFTKKEILSNNALCARMHGVKASEIMFELSNSGSRSPVSVTQHDIREFQLAKAAILTGIEIMLKDSGWTLDDIKTIYLAGAFGSYIDISNAIEVGILPSVPLDKIVSIGNSSGLGTSLMAQDEALWKEGERIIELTQHIELALHSEFQTKFVSNLEF